jgi:hypothetical protein
MPKAKKMSRQENREKDSSRSAQTASEGRISGFFQITTWGDGMGQASFYVQSKGHNAGRPVSTPISNSWAVYTNIPNLKEIAFGIWRSGGLGAIVTGSVIPFIRLREYRPILERAARQATKFDTETLRLIALIEAQTYTISQELQLLKAFQATLVRKIISEVKIFEKP